MNVMDWIMPLCSLILVNIVLSGDNAVVIALASRSLPARQRKTAILIGSGGAIVLRILLTLVAVALLRISYIQFAGGLLLVWIAAKLVMEEDKEENLQASDRLWVAVRTIIVADLVMSLDNTLALAAVADGNLLLLAVGPAPLDPPDRLRGPDHHKVMERFPVVVLGGAALIAWTAGKMMIEDPKVGGYLHFMPEWALPVLVTVGVVTAGLRAQSARRGRQEA
jgi:YjbE family integral membrane protein